MATETVYGYSYARFSHPSQAAGDSLRRQTDGTAAWCKAHGVVYDPSLCLVDAGLSGFRRDDLAVYALGEFLGHVKSGRVPKGSYLVMENLDRLSREEEVVALNLFTSILVAGIKIVTLTPDEVYDKHSDLGQVMKAILELSRGHSESQRKSSTCGPAWREKKERARRERGYVMTKTVPGWIRVGDKGRLELIPERAKVVKQIFELALSGLGVGAIARQLNALGVASWRSTRTANRKRPESRCWDKTAVRNVLTSQAACGVYQPHVGSRSRGRTRPRPIGAPIPNYYPAAVRRQLYDAVQGLRAKRLNKGGRPGRQGTAANLFSGLLRMPDGGTLSIRQIDRRTTVFCPTGFIQADGTKYVAVPAQVFEDAILARLAEVKASDVLPGTRKAGRKVEQLEGQIAAVDELAAQWTAKMDNPRIVDRVAAKLDEFEARRAKLAAELAAARAEVASPLSEQWGKFKSLAGAVQAGGEEVRQRLQAVLRRTIEAITVLFVRQSKDRELARIRGRLLVAQVNFAGGGVRVYALRWWPRTDKTPSCLSYGDKNNATVGEQIGRFVWGETDLRDPEVAAAFQQSCEASELTTDEFNAAWADGSEG